MAVVILGGLVSTTFLSLFVLPALYLRYGSPAEPELAPEDELMHRWAGVEPEAAAAPAGAQRRPGRRAQDAAAAGHRHGEGDGIVTTLNAEALRVLAAGLVVIAALSLSACKEVEEETAAGYEPRKLEPIKGKGEDFQRVTFTKEGAARTDVQTATVRRSGEHKVVPVRGADLQRRGQDLRLHEPEAARVRAGAGHGRPDRGQPGVAVKGAGRRHQGRDCWCDRGVRRRARHRRKPLRAGGNG